jgi:hypothetical protein
MVGCLMALLAAGCGHMVEQRVITAFHQSIQAHDLEKLKSSVSTGFEAEAVVGPASFEAMQLVELPEGELKIVKVVDTKKDGAGKPVEKRVSVKFGPEQRRVVVLLKLDPKKGKWVVDDAYLKREDLEANRSFAAVLAVLTGVHESLEAWKAADRQRMFETSTTEFAHALAGMPAAHLEQLAGKVTSGLAPETRLLPDGRIGDETSTAKVPVADGELLLHLRKIDGRWRLDDLAVESRKAGEGISSARNVAASLGVVERFLGAYRGNDKKAIEQVTTPRFYRGCLKEADLTQVRLPVGPANLRDFDLKLEGIAAAFVLPTEKEMVRISLTRAEDKELHATPRYLVDDVTIFELTTRQDKRLSALFGSQAAMKAYREALIRRDLAKLRAMSTHDFRNRVWDRVQPEHFAWLPLAEIEPAEPRILQTVFRGAMTEVLVEQGSTPLTYQLRDEGGRLVVDDLLVPAASRPQSLKATLEVAGSVVQFARAIAQDDIAGVRGGATSDFTRAVWMHLDAMPVFEPRPTRCLEAPLTSLTVQGDAAEVTLGDDRLGAKVKLLKERGRFRVEDVVLVMGPLPDDRIGLKRAIRTQLAKGPVTAER